MKTRFPMITLAGAAAVAAVHFPNVAIGQTVDSQTAKAIPEPLAVVRPDPETLPGIRLYGSGNADLGVVQHIVKFGDQTFALVTVGSGATKLSDGVVALPARGIQVDGQKLTYDISWSKYSSLPLYDGAMPTWMNKDEDK